MTLNMKKTFEMVVKGKTTMPLPEPVDGITRKSELKLDKLIEFVKKWKKCLI